MPIPFASTADGKEKGDLDIFLSTLESKLRGPFSSLDLAKSVSTLSLRKEGLTPKQFLDQVSQVFNRPDKVVKLRILIGLLGLEPPKKSTSTTGEAAAIGADHNDDPSNVNPDVHHILKLGQDENEEWVKTISGLVQGIMFQDSSNSRESCRGEHAQEVLEKTSDEICQRVEKQVQEQSHAPEFDLNASFAPYRYGMISKELLQPIMPECINGKNPHFQTKSDAKILHIDEEMDIQLAKEEQEHQKHLVGSTSPKHNGGSAASSAAGIAKRADLPPGFRPTSLVSKTSKKGAPPKTNMFMTAKRPSIISNTGNNKSRMLQKTQLRRKGGAQSLLSKSTVKGNATALGGGSTANTAARKGAASGRFAGRFGSGTATASRAAGRTAGGVGGKMALAGGRSRMKMIDVNEVDTLNKEHAKRDGDFSSRSSKKRRILELAKQRGLQNKKAKAAGAAANGAASAGAESKEQEPSFGVESSDPTAMDHDDDDDNDGSFMTPGQQMESSDQQQQQDWQIMLHERSNKLSDEDRVRVQQFFENHYNPTPDQPIYKMKIHEERVNDPTSGQAIRKETFYLELDYNAFTSKQSKKVKQYT